MRLPVTDAAGSGLEAGDPLLVWTTTPWTLISHAAVAAGAEIEYVRARPAVRDEVLVVARPLAERVLGEGWEELGSFPGAALEGVRYEAPFDYITGEDFGPLGHSVLLGDFVTTEDGTGLVHTALAFGEDDYRLGEANGMTLQNPVLPNGHFDERVPDYQGKLVYDHNPEIVEALRESGRLFRVARLRARLPALLALRHRAPLLREVELVPADLRGQGPDARRERGDRLAPGAHQARPLRPLAREQRRLGPLPRALLGNAAADLGVHERGLRRALLRRLDRRPPASASSTAAMSPRTCIGPSSTRSRSSCRARAAAARCAASSRRSTPGTTRARCRSRSSTTRSRTRRSSSRGSRPTSSARASTRPAAGSTPSSPSRCCSSTRPNYRNCVCLGLILDPEGQKMSKTRGNVVDPWEVIDLHGADAFRWYYLTSQQPWAGYRFSAETVGESLRQFLLTLWNTYCFLVLYANAAEGRERRRRADADGPGRRARPLARSRGCRASPPRSRERLDDFDSVGAGKALADYVDELSNWYVRVSRRRFWEGDPAAFATLRHCLLETSKLLAPFVPFTADAIYCNLAGGAAGEFGDAPDSVHLSDFPEPAEALRDAAARGGRRGGAPRGRARPRRPRPGEGRRCASRCAKAVIVATEAERAAIEALRRPRPGRAQRQGARVRRPRRASSPPGR